LLKTVQKWTAEGPKQTIAIAPDADVLQEIIELLREKRHQERSGRQRGETSKEQSSRQVEASPSGKRDRCDRHKKRTQKWMQPTQEGVKEVSRGVGSEDIRKEEWWDDQCGEGMRRLHKDLPAAMSGKQSSC
jgi:hypothetical protein